MTIFGLDGREEPTPLPAGFRLAARTIDVGTFDVPEVDFNSVNYDTYLDSRLIAADPCYAFSNSRHDVENVATGIWHAYVDVTDPIPGWGDEGRESELRAVHESVTDQSTLVWQYKGGIPVDGGQVSIGRLKEGYRDRNPYKDEPRIIENSAVVCGAGFGDGGYDVHEAAVDDEVVGVKIVLITLETATENSKA